MHLLSFLYALGLLVLGVLGLMSAGNPGEIRALGLPGLFFGGAVLFCSFFAFKEPRHGLAGAAFLGFLAFLTSASSLLRPLTSGTMDFSAPGTRLGTALCVASLLYILAAFFAWKRARRQQALAALTGKSPG